MAARHSLAQCRYLAKRKLQQRRGRKAKRLLLAWLKAISEARLTAAR